MSLNDKVLLAAMFLVYRMCAYGIYMMFFEYLFGVVEFFMGRISLNESEAMV